MGAPSGLPYRTGYLQSPNENHERVLRAKHMSSVIKKVINKTEMVPALMLLPVLEGKQILKF